MNTHCPWCGEPMDGDPPPFRLWPTPEEIVLQQMKAHLHIQCAQDLIEWQVYGGMAGVSWDDACRVMTQTYKR